jgi:hypothetical protein
MAASAWTVFATAKHKLGLGKLDLSGATWKIMLFQSSASANLSETAPITSIGSVGTYTASAFNGDDTLALSGIVWTGTASANAATRKWDVTDPVFTASSSTIGNVRYAVIYCSTASVDSVLCYAALSTAMFDVSKGNTLTVQMAQGGVFTLA